MLASSEPGENGDKGERGEEETGIVEVESMFCGMGRAVGATGDGSDMVVDVRGMRID